RHLRRSRRAGRGLLRWDLLLSVHAVQGAAAQRGPGEAARRRSHEANKDRQLWSVHAAHLRAAVAPQRRPDRRPRLQAGDLSQRHALPCQAGPRRRIMTGEQLDREVKAMKIGAIFPQTEIGSDPSGVRDYAQAVEELGFTHILAYDHVIGASPEGRDFPMAYTDQSMFHEPLVLYGYLAPLTRTVEVVTRVVILAQPQAVS